MVILPAIDIKDGNVVRLYKGNYDTVEKVADNFRGNYRVWSKIISTMMKDREEEKMRKKLERQQALRDSE